MTRCSLIKKLFLLLALLPALALFPFLAFGDDIRSVHCPAGCPANPVGNSLLFGHLYALSNNPVTKLADWVAYEVDVTNFGPSPGRDWKADPLLDEKETLEDGDYSHVDKQQLDRGHQAPLASFAGSRYWQELNYLSNITPQASALNRGAWMELENTVRDAVSFRKSLFVITGPLYEKDMPKLSQADEEHQVPSGYYSIIYDRKGSAAVFVMGQDLPTGTAYCSTRTTLKDLSSRLKYTLPPLRDSEEIAERLKCKK